MPTLSDGEWLYQVWPSDHPANLQEPPWLPVEEFAGPIKAAIVMAFLLQDQGNETEAEFTKEGWDRYFEAATEDAPSGFWEGAT